jgi:hypothetical protein
MNNTLGALFNNVKIKPDAQVDTMQKIDNLPEDSVHQDDMKSVLPNEIRDKEQENKKISGEFVMGEQLIDAAELNKKTTEISAEEFGDDISDTGDRRVSKKDIREYKRSLLLKIDRLSKLTGQIIPKLNYDTSLNDLELYSDKVEDEYTRVNKMRIYRLMIRGIAWSVEYICKYVGLKKVQDWYKHIGESIGTFDTYFDDMTKPITTKVKDKEGNVKITTIENPSFLNQLQLSPTTNLILAMATNFILYYGSMQCLDAIDFSNDKIDKEKEKKKNDEYEFLNNADLDQPTVVKSPPDEKK